MQNGQYAKPEKSGSKASKFGPRADCSGPSLRSGSDDSDLHSLKVRVHITRILEAFSSRFVSDLQSEIKSGSSQLGM